jgi:hypothetical protein
MDLGVKSWIFLVLSENTKFVIGKCGWLMNPLYSSELSSMFFVCFLFSDKGDCGQPIEYPWHSP